MIHLEEVSPDNWRLDLHVRNDQKDFAANSITLLARAYAYRNSGSRALIIYNEDIPIGMALYYYIDGAYDFSQFFIDERYQGNGFGYEAAGYVLREMCLSAKSNGEYAVSTRSRLLQLKNTCF